MKTFLRLEDMELSEDVLKSILVELNETQELKRKGLLELKERLMDTKGLRPCLDDDFLLRFLRTGKFDLTKAYDRCQKYYQCHEKYPQIFSKYYPSATVNAQVYRHLWALPFRAPDNSCILIHRRGAFQPATFIYEETARWDALAIETMLQNPITQMCGLTGIVDMKGFCYQLLLYDTPSRLRMVSDIFQKTIPLRFKAMHIVNAPSIAALLYKLVYPLLSTKVRSRVFIHSNFDSVHSHLPPEILPKEFNGHLPDTDLIDVIDLVNSQEEYFRSQLQYGFVRRKQ